MDVEVNSNGVNKSIGYNILSDEKMKELGFHKNYYEGTYHEEYSPYWFFIKKIEFPKDKKYGKIDISFEIHIPKDGSDIDIMVLDDDWCQPYDYQYILTLDPNNRCAVIVNEQVEKWMRYLQENGVLYGHEYGEYI